MAFSADDIGQWLNRKQPAEQTPEPAAPLSPLGAPAQDRLKVMTDFFDGLDMEQSARERRKALLLQLGNDAAS